MSHPGHKKDHLLKTKEMDVLIDALLHSEKFEQLAQKIADTAVGKMMNSSYNETNDKHEKKSKKKHTSDKETHKSRDHQNIDETKNDTDSVSLKFEKFRGIENAAKHKHNKKSKRTITPVIDSSKQSHESKKSEENIKSLKNESKSDVSKPIEKASTPNKDNIQTSHESEETEEHTKDLRIESKLDILQPINVKTEQDKKTNDKSIDSVNSDSVDLSEESPLKFEKHTEINDTSISEEKKSTDNLVDGLSQPIETHKSIQEDKDRSADVSFSGESNENKNSKRKDMRIYREEGSKVYAIELTPEYDEYHEKLMRANANE